jgi:2-polyprenyl-6-methoxyphenol hydroxylase-like FAD-dependent oxidoreductase
MPSTTDRHTIDRHTIDRHTIDRHDVIVVGARAAGAATAMLLARRGLRVLVVDRSPYGGDTLSTHALMRGGVLQLHRWGVLDDVIARGTPAIRRATFFMGREVLPIALKPALGVDALYAPRRTVLDPILVDAAVAAGADVRFGVTVRGLERDGDGRVTGIVAQDANGGAVSTRADLVIGADGIGSSVARWVGAADLVTGTAAGAVAYGYWADMAGDGYEWFFRRGGAAGAIPTNDGEACVFVATTPERFRTELLPAPDTGFTTLLQATAPELADRLAAARRSGQLRRFPGRPAHLRQSWGPGWALVGDAGYFKDPISAHGLTDALRDAELLARAVLAGALDRRDEVDALAEYQTTRDRLSLPLLHTSDAIASYRWTDQEISSLLLQLSSAMSDEVEALAALDTSLSAA